MRLRRLLLLLLAIYLVFVGGSAYYSLLFPVRVLHHVVVTAALAGWLGGRLRRGQGLPKTPLNRPLYAAVGVWLVSAVFSADPRMAFEHLWFPLTHLLFYFVLADFIQRGRQRQLFEIQFFLAALVVIVTGIELASWYFGFGIFPGTGWVDVIGYGVWLPLEVHRVSLAMNISTLLAGYVAPLVTLAGAWALTAQRRYRRALWGLALVLILVLGLTMSRGGYLSLAVAVGTLGVMRVEASQRVMNLRSRRMQLTVGIAVIAALGLGFVIVTTSAGRTGGDLGRVDMWQSAIRMTAENPVTGVGPGLFGPHFRLMRDPRIVQDKLASAHNLYLNTAAETGLPGIAVGIWMVAMFSRAWWRQRQVATGGRQLRLDACFAALVGIGVHSMVDVFTVTPVMLVIALLAASCVVTPRVGFERPPSDQRATGWLALAVVLAYGVWLGWLDVAQSRYQVSLHGGPSALEDARAAAAMDPTMRLYSLQVAYLAAQSAPPSEASGLYEQALVLDPTWDVGWMNLAAHAEADGDIGAALAALDRARALNTGSPASLHWARIVEEHSAAARDDIMLAYRSAMGYPLSDWWWQTPLRRAAVEGWLSDVEAVDLRYRVLAAHDPVRAGALVPSAPVTAADWWVVGQDALASGNAAVAEDAFDRAVALSPRDGDLYVARARARHQNDPDAAHYDLLLADLLGTRFESVNAVRTEMVTDLAEKRRLWAAAVAPRVVTQEFAQVVYGRPASFDVVPQMRAPGPGSAALAPWYALAQSYANEGDFDAAANVYRAILDLAPEDAEARDELEALNQNGVTS